MANGDFQDSNKRTGPDKVLRDKPFKIAKNPIYDGCLHGLSSLVYKFIHNIWGTDLSDIQLISKCNKGFRFLFCVIDMNSKYAWVIPLQDKKGTRVFKNNLDESKRKPNKIWVDKGIEFHNRSMKSFLRNNDIEMYSTHNEGKSAIAETFIRIR